MNRPLQHDPSLGEVDPRSYPLLFRVRFGCTVVGSHERLIQISRLQRLVDNACTEEGDSKTRIHFTVDPKVDAKTSVEVRLQPLTTSGDEEAGFLGRVKSKILSNPLFLASKDWAVLPDG